MFRRFLTRDLVLTMCSGSTLEPVVERFLYAGKVHKSTFESSLSDHHGYIEKDLQANFLYVISVWTIADVF